MSRCFNRCCDPLWEEVQNVNDGTFLRLFETRRMKMLERTEKSVSAFHLGTFNLFDSRKKRSDKKAFLAVWYRIGEIVGRIK